MKGFSDNGLLGRKGMIGCPSVCVIVAALNEEEGILPTLRELQSCLGDCRILVIDGGSSDGTVEISKDMGVEVIRQHGVGKGNAVAEAVAYAGFESDYVVLTDADFTYPAEYVPGMISFLERNPDVGMVCGDRLAEDVGLEPMRRLFAFGNKVLAFTHSLLNGVALRDPLTGLRVMRTCIFRDWKPKSQGFDIEVELNRLVGRKGFDIIEVPIKYRARLGEKKLKIKDGLTILKRIMLGATEDVLVARKGRTALTFQNGLKVNYCRTGAK